MRSSVRFCVVVNIASRRNDCKRQFDFCCLAFECCVHCVLYVCRPVCEFALQRAADVLDDFKRPYTLLRDKVVHTRSAATQSRTATAVVPAETRYMFFALVAFVVTSAA